jgi:hypothetical protein
LGVGEDRVFESIDLIAISVEDGDIRVSQSVEEFVENCPRRERVGVGLEAGNEFPGGGAGVLFEGDEKVGAKEYIEVAEVEFAVRSAIDRFEDDEGVAGNFLYFGILVAVTTIFEVERVEIVAESERFETGHFVVAESMPFHGCSLYYTGFDWEGTDADGTSTAGLAMLLQLE